MMNTYSSIFYFILCIVIALLLNKNFFYRHNNKLTLSEILAFFILFFSVFLGGFHVLGFVNLATNLPAVSPVWGSGLLLCSLIALRFWLPKPSLTLLGRGWSLSEWVDRGDRQLLPGTRLSRRLALLTIVVFSLMAVMLCVTFPRGYEATAYHLPFAVHIFQTQSLNVWSSLFTNHAYPANASIYLGFLLQMVPEHLVSAASVIFVLPLGLATYGLSRATTATKDFSLLAALGLVTIPLIAFGAAVSEADVAGMTFLAISLYFFITNKDAVDVSSLVLCGVAAGLAFGFKSLHLVSIGLIFVMMVLQVLIQTHRLPLTERIWATARPLLVFSTAVFALSAFWLIRNYVEFGNPLSPVHLSIFEYVGWDKAADWDWTQRSLFQFKWVESPSEWLTYPWVEWQRNAVLRPGDNMTAESGFGPFFAATVPVACLAALLYLVTGYNRSKSVWTVLATLLFGGVSVVFTWWILDDHEPRFVMGALVFLFPLVAWTMSLTQGRQQQLYQALATLCIVSMLLIVFSKQLVEFGANVVYGKQFIRYAFYNYPKMIDQLPPGSTVVNLGRRTANYGLFGKGHQNRVVSYMESSHRLGHQLAEIPEEAPQAARLTSSTLRTVGATHLFALKSTTLLVDGCVQLNEIDSMDRGHFIGTPLPDPAVLYEIAYCDASQQAHRKNEDRFRLSSSQHTHPG